jgi:hypothetical protein
MQEQPPDVSTLLLRRRPTGTWQFVLCILIAQLVACEDPPPFMTTPPDRVDIVGTWEMQTPADTPNGFAITVRDAASKSILPWAVIQLKDDGKCMVSARLVVGADHIVRRTKAEASGTWRLSSDTRLVEDSDSPVEVDLVIEVPPSHAGEPKSVEFRDLSVMKGPESLTLWNRFGSADHRLYQVYERRSKDADSSLSERSDPVLE